MNKLFVLLAAVMVVAVSSSVSAETIELRGSVTVYRVMKMFIKAYQAANPEVEIKINYANLRDALGAVKDGNADAAMIIKGNFDSSPKVSGIDFIPLVKKDEDNATFAYGLAVRDSTSEKLQKFIDFIKGDKGEKVLAATTRRRHFTICE